MGLKSLRKKLEEKKHRMQEQVQRGREKSLQMEDERRRKRANKLASLKPGARRAIHEGLLARKSPVDVMKEEYSRRKYERQQKQKGKEEKG